MSLCNYKSKKCTPQACVKGLAGKKKDSVFESGEDI